ncbi:MAG: fimbrillin family protein [Duncaniella sp.]|nr:fimbrillin family protein [Duncaniella sp.]MDE6582225.1 fimbrillin family protein [Duncaniella sp.]
MKKQFFYFAMGAVALTACTSEEVVDVSVQSNAIGFENAVMKQSRADAQVGDLTTDNLDKFMVYGYYTKDGQTANPIQVFGGDAVTKQNGAWTYSGTRFWVPDATYSFFSYSCADVALDNNYGTVGLDLNATGADRQLIITNYRCDAHHNHDLIYAQNKEIKALPKTEENPTPNANVSFKFSHILTKIDAVFTSEFSSDYDIVIKDVRIENFRNIGTFSQTKGWGTTPDRDFRLESNISMRMEFGTADGVGVANASQTNIAQKPKTLARYVIPYKYNYTDVQLLFTIELYKGKNHTAENLVMSRNMEGHWSPKWEQGYYYTYNITLTGTVANLQPIVFEVAQDMNDWTPSTSTATDISFSAN